VIKLEAEASASPNTTPTEAPFSQWEAWVSDTDETKVTNDAEIVTSGADGTSSTQNNIEDDASHKEEEEDKEDTAISGFNPDGWALENWQSRENVEQNAEEEGDFRWWIVQNSSKMHSMPMTCFFVAMIYVTVAIVC